MPLGAGRASQLIRAHSCGTLAVILLPLSVLPTEVLAIAVLAITILAIELLAIAILTSNVLALAALSIAALPIAVLAFPVSRIASPLVALLLAPLLVAAFVGRDPNRLAVDEDLLGDQRIPAADIASVAKHADFAHVAKLDIVEFLLGTHVDDASPPIVATDLRDQERVVMTAEFGPASADDASLKLLHIAPHPLLLDLHFAVARADLRCNKDTLLVDRTSSTLDFHVVPFAEVQLRELRVLTQQDLGSPSVVGPHAGDQVGGVFVMHPDLAQIPDLSFDAHGPLAAHLTLTLGGLLPSLTLTTRHFQVVDVDGFNCIEAAITIVVDADIHQTPRLDAHALSRRLAFSLSAILALLSLLAFSLLPILLCGASATRLLVLTAALLSDRRDRQAASEQAAQQANV